MGSVWYLAKGKTDYHCKIKETLFIQELEPAFNANVGSEKLNMLKYLLNLGSSPLTFVYMWIAVLNFNGYIWKCMYTWIFENRASKDKGSFYYLAIKSNKIRPKADKKAYIWRRAVS